MTLPSRANGPSSGTATAVPDANKSIAYSALSNTLTLTFPGYTGGIVPDGNYENTIASANVADLAGNPRIANNTFDFFFLGADANRDKKVDLTDFRILASRFNSSLPAASARVAAAPLAPATTAPFSAELIVANRPGSDLSEILDAPVSTR
jgi:hypothetical protein